MVKRFSISIAIISVGILSTPFSISFAGSSKEDVTVVQVSDREFDSRSRGFGLDRDNPSPRIAQATPSLQSDTPSSESEPTFQQADPIPSPPTPRTQFTGENRLIFYYNSIKGAKERSFLTPGKNYLEELDLNLTHQFENDIRFEGAFGFRMTDDESVDKERASLQRFYLKFTGITFEATLGDAMANFTQYTLMQNIRGFMAYKDFAVLEGTRVTLLAGVIKDRWEGLWKNTAGETYTRYIEGVRLEQRLTNALTINLNTVTFKDDPGSIPASTQQSTILTTTEIGTTTTTTPTTTIPPIKNHVGSVELSFRPSKDFRVDGEAATSWLDSDSKSSEDEKKSDQAYRMDTRFRIGPARIGGGYNRIEPDYYSAGAFTTSDLEEYYGKVEVDIIEPFMVGASYRNSWNNVKHQREIRTKVLKQEGFFLFTGIKGLFLEGRYKEIKTTASDGLEDKTTKTTSGSLSYQLGPSRLSLSYEDGKKKDAIDPKREGKGYLATSRLDLQIEGEKLRFTPYAGYDKEMDKTPATATKTVQQTTYGGLVLEIPSRAALELSYKHWDADTTEVGLDTIRSETKAELRYFLFGNPSRYLALAFIEKDYEFENLSATSSSNLNGYISTYASNLNYTERRFEAKFVYRF